MSQSELCFLSAWEMARLVRERAVSPVELVQAHLDRVSELNPSLLAFVYLDAEGALAQARKLESQPLVGALHGVPVAYKDIYDVAGMPTTAGSRLRVGSVATEDSAVAAQLRAAGAICLGKLNTFEFASGSMELFGDARNPWNLACSPGGSSSGSGSALAARMIPLATGSDTGGSVRIPASFCGLTGLRPTHGLVSRRGVVPLSWSLDSAGPMARSARDVALMLDAMVGYDARDPTSVPRPEQGYAGHVDDRPTRFRIGIPRQFFFDDEVSPSVVQAVRQSAEGLVDVGAELCEIDLPSAHLGLAASWAIAYAEAFAYHRDDFFSRSRDYTSAFLHKISGAALLSAEEYLAAQRIRERVTNEVLAAYAEHELDAIITPATPYTAFRLGAAPPQDMGRLTRPFSLVGLPSLVFPCGLDEGGMPIGMQIVGRAWRERALIQIGLAYQQITSWHDRLPPMTERDITDAPAPEASAVLNPDWVKARAAAFGLTYLEESDVGPIAASIAPMLADLEHARAVLTSEDAPSVRAVPGVEDPR